MLEQATVNPGRTVVAGRSYSHPPLQELANAFSACGEPAFTNMARGLALSKMEKTRPIKFVEVQYRPPPGVSRASVFEDG